VLLPRADIGREVIAEQLREAGALVTDVIAYRNVLDDPQTSGGPDIYRMLLDGEIRIVTFTSASAVRNFTKVLGPEQAADLLKKTIVAAIGPVTADAAARLGIETTVQPTTYTVPALVEAIVAHVLAERAAS
jgi:uroporphyrinogen III methyltransferase/synthase